MLGESLALAAALTWAISVILFKRSEVVGAYAMNLFKNVAALLLLAVTLPILGESVDWDRPWEDWLALLFSGVVGIAVADTLIFESLRRVGAAVLAVVELIYAPTLVLLSVVFLGEGVSVGFLVGAALVLGGVLVVTAPQARGAPRPGATTAAERHLRAGVVMGLVGVVAMGVGVIAAKPVLERSGLVEVTAIRLAAGVAGQLVWAAVSPRTRPALRVLRPQRVWWTLVPAAVLGAYVAMLLWLGGFKWADASVASVLNQTSTIFTIVLARLFLGDRLGRRRAWGAALAFGGTLIVLLGR